MIADHNEIHLLFLHLRLINGLFLLRHFFMFSLNYMYNIINSSFTPKIKWSSHIQSSNILSISSMPFRSYSFVFDEALYFSTNLLLNLFFFSSIIYLVLIYFTSLCFFYFFRSYSASLNDLIFFNHALNPIPCS